MLTLVIQSGGQSSRMGEDKALKPFLGQPLIQRVLTRLSPLADEIIVTTNRPKDYQFLQAVKLGNFEIRLVADLISGRGALGGLYTALAAATHPLVAVAACDMPFASRALFAHSIESMNQKGADVVIAKTEEGYEPFHALYRRETCLPAIQAALQADKWKVISWFADVRVYELSGEEVKQSDPSGLCFHNLNTPEEFAAAEKTSKLAN